MPSTDKKGNTIYRMQSQMTSPSGQKLDRGQQLGNIVRDYTSANRYVYRGWFLLAARQN